MFLGNIISLKTGKITFIASLNLDNFRKSNFIIHINYDVESLQSILPAGYQLIVSKSPVSLARLLLHLIFSIIDWFIHAG